jgi:Diacylglycerol kinase catalytic domain
MTGTGPLWLAINRASGSNDDATVAALVAVFAAAGAEPARTIDCSSADLPSRAALESAEVACLAIFTGDGTINALVPPLEGWAGQVLVLPGGTANLLARSLHGDADAASIVRAFAAGELGQVQPPCIRVGSHTALVEVLAGPGAAWSDVREGMREGDLAGIANTAVEAVRQSASGPMVTVVAPALGRREGYAGVRLALSATGMSVDGYGADTLGDYFRQGLALLRRDFREGPHDELGEHPQVACRSADGSPIALMIDGERMDGAGEQTFVLETLHVNLLAQRNG